MASHEKPPVAPEATPPAAPEKKVAVVVEAGHSVQTGGRQHFGPGCTIDVLASEVKKLIAAGVVSIPKKT